MIRQRKGTIINMSSQAGFAALPTESVYCMTKAAIAHLMACPVIPLTSLNTLANWTFICVSAFCIR
jgi:hypothetical protein